MSKQEKQEHLKGVQKQLWQELVQRFSPTVVDVRVRGSEVYMTFPDLGTDLEIVILPDRVYTVPIERLTIRLNDCTTGWVGGQKTEVVATSKTKPIDLTKVADCAVELYQKVKSLYWFRCAVKQMCWQVLGLDPREVELIREIQYHGRAMTTWIRWQYHGSDGPCVEFGVEQYQRLGQRLLWHFMMGTPLDPEKFRQELQKGIQTWQQQENQETENEAAVTRLRKQYPDLDEVSLEANQDNIRVVLFLKTESEVQGLLEWVRIRQK